MSPVKYTPYISDLYQEVLLETLDRVEERVDEICQSFLEGAGLQFGVQRARQFVLLALLEVVFAVPATATHRVFSHPAAGKIRDHITNIAGKFPGGSTVTRRLRQVKKYCWEEVLALGTDTLDDLQVGVGRRARETLRTHLATTRAKITPPPECFTGIIPPSVAFPQLPVEQRANVTRFLNAYLYSAGRRLSSVAELVGALKTPVLGGGGIQFELAGRLGFVDGAPGKNEFYLQFQWIEAHMDPLDAVINAELAKTGVHDLTFASVDSTNLPVDKRDKTGSQGTGSRGTFFGHKASIGAGANCLPASVEVAPGRAADPALFSPTFQPVVDLARVGGQDLWVLGADAAYATPGVIDEVEAAVTVPLVDLNPKNSPLLRRLSATKKQLSPLSRKALKANTTAEERKQWLAECQAFSAASGGRVGLPEKKRKLRDVLRKVADRVRRRGKGLSPAEWRSKEKLRRDMVKIRAEIRERGTPAEQRVGLPVIIHGSVEWHVAYGLRGQNEGINGIMKKRGDVIGDGQHTTWVVGDRAVGDRTRGNLTCLRVIAWIHFHVTGETRHSLRALHNWTGRRGTRKAGNYFTVYLLVIFCR